MQMSEGLPYRISTKYGKIYDIHEEPSFMVLCKLGLIMDQCGITR
jgi:hypothetical protein